VSGGVWGGRPPRASGFFTVTIDVESSGGGFAVTRSALLRTARLLMRGEVLVPGSVWDQGGPR
jgi:4-oxalomesaconate tautomerase